MSASCSTSESTCCLQCGDSGLTNAFVYCVECLKFDVHRYCLYVIPDTVDEFVRWLCNDCDSKLKNQSAAKCKARDHSTYNRGQGVMDKTERKRSKTVQRNNGRECLTTLLPASPVVQQQQAPPAPVAHHAPPADPITYSQPQPAPVAHHAPPADPIAYSQPQPAPPLPGGDDRVDVAPHYDAPFPLYSDIEGQAYTLLANKFISVPRYIDWRLLESLRIDDHVSKLLKILGLERYAKMELPGYSPLCFEFFSTLVLHDGHSSLTCRMMGKEFTVTRKIMEDVFGFPTSGAREKPAGFSSEEVWNELSGRVKSSWRGNWSEYGWISGLIKDPALAILHKFLAFNVTGKDHAMIVNNTEEFLLWSAIHNKKVCPTDFIWNQLKFIKSHSVYHVTLCQIITGLAIHFGLVDPHGPPPPGQTIVHSSPIDLAAELEADLMREVQNAKAVAELASEGGPSRAPDNIDAPLLPDTEPELNTELAPAPQMISTEGFQLLQDDLRPSPDHNDTTLSDFRKEMFSLAQRLTVLETARVVDERAAKQKDEENRKLKMRLDMIERRLAEIEGNHASSDTSLL